MEISQFGIKRQKFGIKLVTKGQVTSVKRLQNLHYKH